MIYWQVLKTFKIKISIFLVFSLLLSSCSNKNRTTEIEGLIIDPKIKIEVEKYILENTEYADFGDLMQVYANSAMMKGYENDSLIFHNEDSSKKMPFKSFYLWNKDTLGINGAYGLFGGFGFYIELVEKKATLFHLLSSDDFPSYAYKENDSLIERLEVTCTETKIIVSEIPNRDKKQIIYGYVEFKSNEYFASQGSVNNEEILPRKRFRTDMKIYFKSGFLNMPH